MVVPHEPGPADDAGCPTRKPRPSQRPPARPPDGDDDTDRGDPDGTYVPYQKSSRPTETAVDPSDADRTFVPSAAAGDPDRTGVSDAEDPDQTFVPSSAALDPDRTEVRDAGDPDRTFVPSAAAAGLDRTEVRRSGDPDLTHRPGGGDGGSPRTGPAADAGTRTDDTYVRADQSAEVAAEDGDGPNTERAARRETRPRRREDRTDAASLIGKTISRYRIESFLGEGGMGRVYRARDDVLRGTVALKTMRVDDRDVSEVDIRRFHQEARAAAKCDSPFIAKVWDEGYDAHYDLHYLVLEYVDGRTIAKYAERLDGRLTPEEGLRFLEQACQGLLAAEERDIVHRDIKPDNLLLKTYPEDPNRIDVRIVDFGAAKELNVNITLDPGGSPKTIRWASPEQLDAREVSHPSDIYSLGATFYWLLTGDMPFPGNETHVRQAKRTTQFLNPRAKIPEIPEKLATIIAKMTARDLEVRYASFREVLEDIRSIREDTSLTIRELERKVKHLESRPRRRLAWIMAATTCLAVGGTAVASYIFVGGGEGASNPAATSRTTPEEELHKTVLKAIPTLQKIIDGPISKTITPITQAADDYKGLPGVRLDEGKAIADDVSNLLSALQSYAQKREATALRTILNPAPEKTCSDDQLRYRLTQRAEDYEKTAEGAAKVFSKLPEVRMHLKEILDPERPTKERESLCGRIEEVLGDSNDTSILSTAIITDWIAKAKEERADSLNRAIDQLFPGTARSQKDLPDAEGANSIATAAKNQLGDEQPMLAVLGNTEKLASEIRAFELPSITLPDCDPEQVHEQLLSFHRDTVNTQDEALRNLDQKYDDYKEKLRAVDDPPHNTPPDAVDRSFRQIRQHLKDELDSRLYHFKDGLLMKAAMVLESHIGSDPKDAPISLEQLESRSRDDRALCETLRHDIDTTKQRAAALRNWILGLERAAEEYSGPDIKRRDALQILVYILSQQQQLVDKVAKTLGESLRQAEARLDPSPLDQFGDRIRGSLLHGNEELRNQARARMRDLWPQYYKVPPDLWILDWTVDNDESKPLYGIGDSPDLKLVLVWPTSKPDCEPFLAETQIVDTDRFKKILEHRGGLLKNVLVALGQAKSNGQGSFEISHGYSYNQLGFQAAQIAALIVGATIPSELQLQALFDPAPAEINPALAEKRFRQIAEVDIEWTSTSPRELENKVRYKDKNGSGFRYHISTTKDQISYRFVYPLERTPQ